MEREGRGREREEGERGRREREGGGRTIIDLPHHHLGTVL